MNIYNSHMTAFIAFLIVFSLLLAGKHLIVRKLKDSASQTESILDDSIFVIAKKSNTLFLAVFSLFVAIQFTDIPSEMALWFKKILIVMSGLQASIWLVNLSSIAINDKLSEKVNGRLVESAMATVSILLVRILIFGVIALLVLDNFGINVGALVTGFGIGGVAIALAVQKILGDLFASLSIALDKPFRVGEFIIVDDLLGTIERVGLKTTRVRALSGEQIIFPNSSLLESKIRNFSKMLDRRVTLKISVVYGTSAEKLEHICGAVCKIIQQTKGVRLERGHFAELGSSSLDFEFIYWVDSPDYNIYMHKKQEIILNIKRYFDDNAIEFAFPTQLVYTQSLNTEGR